MPSLETQQLIEAIDSLHRRENMLMQLIQQKRSQLIDAICAKAEPADIPTGKVEDMPDDFDQSQINGIVWKACDTFRGAVDPVGVQELHPHDVVPQVPQRPLEGQEARVRGEYKGDTERIKRALSRERFVFPDECDFDHLYAKRDAANIGELINIALEKIEDANKAKLENVFRNIDFNSEPALGQTKERNRRLKTCWRTSTIPGSTCGRPIGHRDIIGDVYEYLIGQFAAGAGKKAGEFYTPPRFRRCWPSSWPKAG